ncbi:hypothetical protein ESP47_13465 [Heyndrickxia coagulans]|nr:hypothetical protein C3766_17655 [Heyndrickxia coagulans]MDR4224237.1 hypothetical protein [Heyndrickxia coagulans DSM 1 = ATCC 7050]AWP38689.1 hypothetical protein CYJ15_17890 [Heyndrickxia coagulans]QAU27955.1 hypothetical protein ESP47_13465 [Heyndrickxia coagulans]QDI60995.1 hypothetical protein DXF96_05345 [Heyndrickxia coagulans]
MPCFKYFSFNFPTVTIEIFTTYTHLTHKLLTRVIHISTETIHILCGNNRSIQDIFHHFSLFTACL